MGNKYDLKSAKEWIKEIAGAPPSSDKAALLISHADIGRIQANAVRWATFKMQHHKSNELIAYAMADRHISWWFHGSNRNNNHFHIKFFMTFSEN